MTVLVGMRCAAKRNVLALLLALVGLMRLRVCWSKTREFGINDPPQESPAFMSGEECGVPFSGEGWSGHVHTRYHLTFCVNNCTLVL
jgi:hypothetical protein